MPVITISRTLGSEGAAIGKALAKRFRYRYFDREELETIACKHRFQRADVAVMDEKSLPLFDVLFRDRPKDYLSFLHDAVCDAAEEGNLVIVGRGGQAILRELPTAFHVRVEAPLHTRVARIMERFGESEAKARKRIKEVDGEREKFVRQAFGVNSSDPGNYHLVVNTGELDVPTATKIIAQAFRQIPWKAKEEQARGVLQRHRLLKAIRAALIQHPEITCPSCVDVRCDASSVVTLTGRLTEPSEKGLIERVVCEVKGVERVVNQLRP